MCAKDPDSNPHACATGIFLAEPWLQLWLCFQNTRNKQQVEVFIGETGPGKQERGHKSAELGTAELAGAAWPLCVRG